MLGALFIIAALPSGAIALTREEGEPSSYVTLAFDPRLTPEILAQSWHKPSVDGSDNIDSDWTALGYAASSIALFAFDGRVVSHHAFPEGRAHETRRLGKIARVQLGGRGLFMLSVDYSEARGRFSGDAVFFYEVKYNRLYRVSTTLPDGSSRQTLTVMNAADSAWRFAPSDAQATELLSVESISDPVAENIFTRVSLQDGHWVRHEKHAPPRTFGSAAAKLSRNNFD